MTEREQRVPIFPVGGLRHACELAADAALRRARARREHDDKPDVWHEIEAGAGRIQCSVCTALYPPPPEVEVPFAGQLALRNGVITRVDD